MTTSERSNTTAGTTAAQDAKLEHQGTPTTALSPEPRETECKQ